MQSDEYLDWMCIGIRKESETDSSCVYRFTTNRFRQIDAHCCEELDPVSGTFKIDKQSGQTELVEPMPGDDKMGIYRRAAQKIMRHWSNGDLPSSALYAAG